MGAARGRLSQQQRAARAAARADRVARSSALWLEALDLLGREEFETAAQRGVEAFVSLKPTSKSHRGGMVVYGSADVPIGLCLMDPERRVAVVNLGVWKRHCCTPSLYRFADRGLDLGGPVWARFDVSDWDLSKDVNRMRLNLEPLYYGRLIR